MVTPIKCCRRKLVPMPMRTTRKLCVFTFLLVSLGFAQAAQLDQQYQHSPATQVEKKADLTTLINETLAINNRSVPSTDKFAPKDDWTFDMVEYDLIEFLQDLSARYKLQNKLESAKDDESQSGLLEAKNGQFEAKKTEPTQQAPHNNPNITTDEIRPLVSVQSNSKPAPVELQKNKELQETPLIVHPTGRPEMSTSLASGDHEIAESSWAQYGIFDRFTRARSTSTTTSSPELVPELDGDRLNVRAFNSDECGLRRYDEEVRYSPQLVDPDAEASKDLIQRRQRPALKGNHKKYQFDSAEDWAADRDREIQSEKEAYDSYDKQLPPANQPQDSQTMANWDNEFNLSSRRQWLQQQLGNTLKMLGFNGSTMALSEFVNKSSNLSENLRENLRENMMKMSNSSKLLNGIAKASKLDDHSGEGAAEEISEKQLNARQDELKLEARVIGGSDARPGDSPWSVSLQALVSRPGTGGVEYRHYCGGTIISEYYILTAAHCLDFMVGRESRLFVVVGDINWRMSAASLHGRRLAIEKLIIHGGYKSTAFGHDIGLIKTRERIKPLKVNGRYIVNSVCLPEKGVEHSGEAELVGWGLFSNRNEMADSLQIADVPILPRPLCVDLYRRRTGLIQWLIGIELITDKQVCAGTFGRGICQGDSGSALVFNERRKDGDGLRSSDRTRATTIGVVAFGGIRRCSYQSLPGVYMQTSKYLDWILPRVQS